MILPAENGSSEGDYATPNPTYGRTPFGSTAKRYRAQGWLGTLPLPAKAKQEPPKGYTGHGAPYPTKSDVDRWRRDHASGNIALRLGEVALNALRGIALPVVYGGNTVDGWELIGVDVDDYAPKTGAAQLSQLEAQLGPLPATVVSSARWETAPLSGTRLFLVPKGFRYKGKAAPTGHVGPSHIDVLYAGLRYLVVWPSVHPTGLRYEFRYGVPGGDDALAFYDDVPPLADVAVLPEAWFSHLLSNTGDYADVKSGLGSGELEEWAEATFTGCLGEPCRLMTADVAKYIDALDESDQHTPLNNVVWRLTQNALEGHAGWYSAVRAYVDGWAEVSNAKRELDEMQGEVERSIEGALKKAKPVFEARGEYLADDTCAVDRSQFDCEGWGAKAKAVASQQGAGPTPLGELDDADPDAGEYGWLSDANVSKLLVEQVLRGKYCWAVGFGWMKWDGHRWKGTTDADVIERSRRFARRLVADAARREDPDKIKVYTRRLGSGAIGAAANLAKGQLLVDGADFDCHPDLLNVGNGVVDLRTGQLLPPDPSLLLTRWTPTDYDHDATHSDWNAALSALPAEVRAWAQVRLGQGITGHSTPDDVLVVFQGGGENGKSTVTVGINKALGDHAVTVPERLLTANPGDHPTELMTLRGTRLAMMEETPEARYLNVKRLKDVLGTPTMTARLMHKDNVSWTATHSLFLSTNYRPRVSETDHGTWRRLLLVRFPFTYRKTHEELTSSFDRRGDAGLRERVKLSPSKQHEAVLRWLVDGAMRWYSAGQEMPSPPEPVERDTRRWRQTSDPIVELFDDCLIADEGYYIPTSELLSAFTYRLTEAGQKTWSDRTFAERFEGHDETKRRRIYRDRVRPGSTELTASVLPLTRAALPDRLRAWIGVRFRTEADDDDGGGDQAK